MSHLIFIVFKFFFFFRVYQVFQAQGWRLSTKLPAVLTLYVSVNAHEEVLSVKEKSLLQLCRCLRGKKKSNLLYVVKALCSPAAVRPQAVMAVVM